eukprot:TRINITY_DN3357_c0_g1_i2.p1 TRINITY_DN3357_c0_g1~~TRINITY_DN3357_c0_g1_i2.p1  ORF type:complete len:290 (-),score=53.90 TRINITY_DN3357_c0_g1_i2:63-932(-)
MAAVVLSSGMCTEASPEMEVVPEELPVKNTFIHFDVQKSGARVRALRRWSTDPTEPCKPPPALVRPPSSLVQDELKKDEEDTRSETPSVAAPSRSNYAGSSTATGSLPPSPGGAATPETPIGSPQQALPWASPAGTWTGSSNMAGFEPVPMLCAPGPCGNAWQPSSFTFTLRRADNTPMGLSRVAERTDEFVVEQVAPGSALDAWNRFQISGDPSDRSVRAGDRLLSVNDFTEPLAMMEECASKHLLKVCVLRGPESQVAAQVPECGAYAPLPLRSLTSELYAWQFSEL